MTARAGERVIADKRDGVLHLLVHGAADAGCGEPAGAAREAAALRLSPSGLTRRLDGMVKAGWVERASCSADRRVMYAHLTEKGRKKMEAAAPDHVASVRRHFIEPLGAAGVEQLGELFEQIRNHLYAAAPV